jgi:hypothetical protein
VDPPEVLGDRPGLRTYVTAAETRAQDAYAFVSVQKFPADAFTRQKKEPESSSTTTGRVEQRDDRAEDQENPKTNKKPSSFKGGKGASTSSPARRTGSRSSSAGGSSRAARTCSGEDQLGGKAGDATLGPLAKKLVDSIKFS